MWFIQHATAHKVINMPRDVNAIPVPFHLHLLNFIPFYLVFSSSDCYHHRLIPIH